MTITEDNKPKDEKLPVLKPVGKSAIQKRRSDGFSVELQSYVDASLIGEDKKLYNVFFKAITQDYELKRSGDLLLLDTICFDFVRMKRLQKILSEKGDTVEVTLRNGDVVTKANEASYLLNAIESQFRANMKELMITKRESAKYELGLDTKDFANWISGENIIDVESEDEHGTDEKSD